MACLLHTHGTFLPLGRRVIFQRAGNPIHQNAVRSFQSGRNEQHRESTRDKRAGRAKTSFHQQRRHSQRRPCSRMKGLAFLEYLTFCGQKAMFLYMSYCYPYMNLQNQRRIKGSLCYIRKSRFLSNRRFCHITP